ncbi:hypothetical protein OCU04_008639 [Sclerotinia nivalis]|uniref:C2H2-type domain-containing protein n=1 Tax=Sclerotinia nivalis TaxID=352851 RepID=A0A9X0AIH8_9HELO|nr:hypothetical protein OCU04_008639 [Sclerotinia nivalis]
MVYCSPCDRYFNSERSYNQHIENSYTHCNNVYPNYGYSSNYKEPEFECEGCDTWFWSSKAREDHHISQHSHRYCRSCERMFMNENNLMQHQRSKIHQGFGMKCPFCPTQYPTASALIIHLESGSCPSGTNRQMINEQIRRLDRNHIITTRQIEYPSSSSTSIATQRSWNGYRYECGLCSREFNTLQGLNGHLNSPVHEQKIYRCPGPRCAREFKLLSSLVQHVESETCGLMKFSNVQNTARGGINNMVGRMIQY